MLYVLPCVLPIAGATKYKDDAKLKLVHNGVQPDNLAVEESLFHTANGYIGVRACLEEGCPADITSIRGCYINGFYDDVPIQYSEKLYGFPETGQRIVNLPDIQSVKITIDDEVFSVFEGEVLHHRRTLDTDTGIVEREVQWKSPKGHLVAVRFRRIASFQVPELFLHTCCIQNMGNGCRVGLQYIINCDVYNFADASDPRVAAERMRHIQLEDSGTTATGGWAACRTTASGLGLGVNRSHKATKGTVVYSKAGQRVVSALEVCLEPQEELEVETYTVLTDTRKQANPVAHGAQVLAHCMEQGAAALFAEQKDYLRQFWAGSRVQVQGNEQVAQGLEYSLYNLLQSAGRDSISNVAAKGISGEGYEGHYFWDTEIYIFPFFLLTQPRIARNLLEYRYSILGKAREHARIMGHKRGALYAWRTISGSECSAYYPAGSAQYHITGDVAHSILDYYTVTDDVEFMQQMGAEILLETARVWLEAGHYNAAGEFLLDCVTGPDEYTCLVNNNYYTNNIAKYNLAGAVRVYNDLREKGLHHAVAQRIQFEEAELEAFAKAAHAMRLPYNEELGISAQDDSFLQKAVWDFAGQPAEKTPLLLHYHPLYLYRYQVCKQGDVVLSHFLFDEEVPFDVIKRSYDYYEKITTHDSTLSNCIFSIMACKVGYPARAVEYYMRTLRTDLDNTHKNTKDGIHTANMGGAYLGLLFGFAGLRIRQNGPHFSFRLPAGWQGYEFCIRWRGSVVRVAVGGGSAQLALEEGPPVQVYCNGVPHTITAQHVLADVVQQETE